jgi:CcmD family protein
MHIEYLAAAYILVWVGLLAYVVSLGRRNSTLERDVAELRRLLDQGQR